MDKSAVINAVAQLLSNNIGNKLTLELANGIIVALGQAWVETPPKEAEE